MTIPAASTFPDKYDNDTNLFWVKDALRVRLLEDYNPGDKSIIVEGDPLVMANFPPTGLITLTEQCSDIDFRALSFHYSSVDSTGFQGLKILPEFTALDSVKPKKITNVTMNVVAMHHNSLKDSLVATQKYIGTKRSSDKNTITGKISYLESLAFRPRAWFSADSTVGLAPLTVTFSNDSFRLGPGRVTQTWDFGEGDPVEFSASGPEEYKSYSDNINGVVVEGHLVRKTYLTPGVYTVSLVVENEYGESEVSFQDMITVKIECPEAASIRINPRATQSYSDGDPAEGTVPRIRSVANSFIDMEIPNGENPRRPGYSYGGELLDGSGEPVDPILEYTWSLGDDMPHSNSQYARASYSAGGIYDAVLRVDTRFGSYRITKLENAIDIVESRNLWLFAFSNLNQNGSGSVKAYEFGLNGETFKLLGNQTLNVDRNKNFLSPYGNAQYNPSTLPRANSEFDRNSEFVPYGTLSSGLRGNSMLFWARGGQSVDSQEISAVRYNAFDDFYESLGNLSGRPWNWVALNSPEKSYFLFGSAASSSPGVNPAAAIRTDYDLSTNSSSAAMSLGPSSFENGAEELLAHPSNFNEGGVPTNGNFATYRSAWKDSVGYMLRNSAVNEFFRISSFYKTKGSVGTPFSTITKLPDMTGSAKVEGELVSMSNGIFFFGNSGEISAWNDTTLTWEIGRAGSAALTFRSVQDMSESGFDSPSNTLLASSDGDRVAYLSYDYSERAFIKFNGTDLTFSTVRRRPSGHQFKMGVY